MSNPPRCHTCQHPGRWHRKATRNKKPCDCACHTAPTVYGKHTWPVWVDADIVFEGVVWVDADIDFEAVA